MSSPHLSFRLNYYQLAKALRILVTLEPNQPIPSLSQAAKMIIIDWIAKHSINAPLAVAQSDVEAVKLISKMSTNQIDPYTTIHKLMANANSTQSFQATQMIQKSARQIQQEIEDEKLFNEVRREALAKRQQSAQTKQSYMSDEELDEQLNLAMKTSEQVKPSKRIKPSEFHDPNITESSISSVTDFSPPDEWKE